MELLRIDYLKIGWKKIIPTGYKKFGIKLLIAMADKSMILVTAHA